MQFGIRADINPADVAGSLSGLQGIPIELALPYKLEDYLEHRGTMLAAIPEAVKAVGCVVQSVHAPQGPLTDWGIIDWGEETIRLAEALGASVAVFHPEASAMDRRLDRQVTALQHVKRLSRLSDQVIVGIEAFGNKKRILTPEEICEKGLDLVLDTSHLFPERSLEIVKEWNDRICLVHLSEGRDGGQHQPVKDYGYKILDALLEKGWRGPVTLEYMAEFREQAFVDRQLLEEKYGK